MKILKKALLSFLRSEDTQVPNLSSVSRTSEKPVVLYFSPHQDDELLTLGIDACSTIAGGEYQVHTVLCTDGSMSKMRLKINDGKECRLHAGVHQYELDIPQFIAARDIEFQQSCLALGYQPSAIHYFPMRAIDSCLTVEIAEAIITSVLSQFPQGTSVRTISPFGGKAQHKDHQCLGQAALNLYRKGVIKDLRLFIEPYCLASSREAFPDLKLTEIRADSQTLERLKKAIQAYSTWEPEQQRYAIGYHSVTSMFSAFAADAAAYYHLPEDLV